MAEINAAVIEPLKEFATRSIQLVKKCTKPDRKGEWLRARAALAVDRVATCRRSPFRSRCPPPSHTLRLSPRPQPRSQNS